MTLATTPPISERGVKAHMAKIFTKLELDFVDGPDRRPELEKFRQAYAKLTVEDLMGAQPDTEAELEPEAPTPQLLAIVTADEMVFREHGALARRQAGEIERGRRSGGRRMPWWLILAGILAAAAVGAVATALAIGPHERVVEVPIREVVTATPGPSPSPVVVEKILIATPSPAPAATAVPISVPEPTAEPTAAVEWLVKTAQRYGSRGEAERTFQNAPIHRFASGHLGMDAFVDGHLRLILNSEPSFEIGAGPLPYALPGAPNPGWVGGFKNALVQGSKAPDAGWQLAHWIGFTEEGTTTAFRKRGRLPGWRGSSVWSEVESHPILQHYYHVLRTAQHAHLTIPTAIHYYGIIAEEMDKALDGKTTPREAMETTSRRAQQTLDDFLRRTEV